MAGTDKFCLAPIDICGVQINSNNCDGSVKNGATDVVVSCGFSELTLTAIVGEDNGATSVNGQGQYCVERENDPNLEGYTVGGTLCAKLDAALLDMMGIVELARDDANQCMGVKAIGRDSACDCGSAGTCKKRVSMIFWHTPYAGKKKLSENYQFLVTILPDVRFTVTGTSFTFNREFNDITIEGTTRLNENYGQGPGGIYRNASGLDRDFATIGTNTGPPQGLCGCELCGYASAGTALGN